MKRTLTWTLALMLIVGALAWAQGPEGGKDKTRPATGGAQKTDITGRWSGTLEYKRDDGESRSGPAYLILKQEGDKVSGSGGPNEGEQHPIQNGKVEKGRFTFEVLTDGPTMYADLAVQGDQLTGDMKRTRDGVTQNSKLTLKRVTQ